MVDGPGPLPRSQQSFAARQDIQQRKKDLTTVAAASFAIGPLGRRTLEKGGTQKRGLSNNDVDD